MFTVIVHGDKLILVDHYYFDISLRIIVMNVLLSRRIHIHVDFSATMTIRNSEFT